MQKVKYLLLAAVIAAGTVGGARPAAATVSATAAIVVPDGWYPVRDENGQVIGYILIRDNQVVDSQPAN